MTQTTQNLAAGEHWLTRLWGRLPARRFQFLLDVVALSAAFFFAYLLRFDFEIPELILRNALLVQLPVVIFIQFLALSRAGVYSFIWRYVSLGDMSAFVLAFAGAAVPVTALRLWLPASLHEFRVPLSVIIMDSLLAFTMLIGLRAMRRILYERYERRLRAAEAPAGAAKPTLLVGAGRAGVLAAGEIIQREDMRMDVHGFVDDDRHKTGAKIHGYRVLGGIDDLPALVKEHGIEQVVITIARPSREAMARIVGHCESVGVKARIIPGLYEILGGQVETTRVRDVQIEDLLGRQPVELDVATLGSFLTDKVVMVTGAGGSIGSELCRQVTRFAPDKLLLVERAEPALFEIARELTEKGLDFDTVPLLADVGDTKRMRSIFGLWRPEIVLHAAAHKHVPLMESNPVETVKNNIFGTRTVGELCGEYGVSTFVFISTDKAVRPTSMMGASKRVAELVVQDLDRRFQTRYVAVRFGNVLGSNGSVIPIFREQIARRGPVTVTHPDMKRYFMTIPEASQLVLQAGAMGMGGEIFVLDMGQEIRIFDLAKRMITLSGFRPHEDIPIEFTGLRPGEKLFEELMKEGESIETRHPKIFIGKIEPCPQDVLTASLGALDTLVERYDEAGVRRQLADMLPEASLSGVSRPAESSEPIPRTVRSSTSPLETVPDATF